MTKTSQVQRPRAVIQRFGFADIPLATEPLCEVPAGAIVTRGSLVIVTPFGSSRTFDVGDATDPNRYTASPIDGNTAARTALTLTGYKHTATEVLSLVRAAGDAPAAGEGYVELEYIVEGAMDSVQG